jgi:hypothetical protein
VWVGHDTNKDKVVVIKVFRSMDKGSLESFQVEVKSAQLGLNHPNILKMLGCGRSFIMKGRKEEKECVYMVSEMCSNG